MLDLKKIQQGLQSWQKESRMQLQRWHYVMFFLLIFSLTAVLAFDFLSVKVSLSVGEIAPRDIVAPRTIEFIDRYKTMQLEEAALKAVERIYDFRTETSNQMKHDIHMIYNLFLEVKNSDLSPEKKLIAIRKKLLIKLSEENIKTGLRLSDDKLMVLEQVSLKLNQQFLDVGLKDDKLEEAQATLAEKIDALSFSVAERTLLKEVTQKTLSPNVVFNEAKTMKKKEAAKQSVQPVENIIPKGLVIIRKGDQVTQEHIYLLEALGLQRARVSYQTIFGLLLLNFLLILLLVIYLLRYLPQTLAKKNQIFLLMLLVLGTTFLNKVLSVNGMTSFGSGVGFIAAGSMLVAILLNQKLAIFVNVILAIHIGLMHFNDVGAFFLAFVAGMTGIYSVSHLSQRDDLTTACLRISGVNILAILTIGLIYGKIWADIFIGFIWGISGGISSTVLMIGFLPFLEKTFGITTALTLLELGNPNEPLLRRLMMEAPGTYQHSVVVANLAEAAAEKVDANSLLVRVGSYYHDIGKLRRPCFFIENQFSEDNPHDTISPTLSTLIIISHVKDGLALAREHHLPENVRDIMQQHHGNSLVSYFYHRASEKGETVEEEAFRYPGPKPQTKEAGIVMMADSVEAAVRSLNKLNPARLESMVKKIIHDKLYSGQLDECNLTLKELDMITNAFIHVLGGIFHSRIEYPEIMKEMEGR